MITKLPTDRELNFTHIVHLADIHIRLTKRHDEYQEVFKKLEKDLLRLPQSTAIFVLGDVVNSKIDLSPECVGLAATFLFQLASIRPTILFAGNHDTNLTNRSRMDSLSPIVEALDLTDLYYLKESGLYGIGNVCINNYSVFDTPDKYIKGSDIPSAYRNEYEHFVVAYHGQVDGAMTDLGFKLSHPAMTLDMFDKHDIAMLGDIHKEQDLQLYDESNDKPLVRYCGSLIQQKHDEPIAGHGYSIWDLEKKEYTHIDVPNEYGFYTVMLDNGVITSDLSNLPKKMRVRFQLKNTMPSDVKKAIVEVKKITEVVDSSYQKLDSGVTLIRIPTAAGSIALGNITDKTYQSVLLTEYLKNRLKITDQTFIDDIIKINDDVNGYIKKDDFARNIRWTPIKFEWNNLFSYGEQNVVDFTKMKDLMGVFAANASGKSSLFSALTFCIFDKCEREYKAENILNTQKDALYAKFEFEIDGKRYFIERSGKKDKKGKVKIDVRFWKVENGQEIDLNGEQRRDTNVMIREYLGSYEEFVLTSLSVQSGKNNASVIDMGDTDRKDLFAQFMGLTVFDRLFNEANDRLKDKISLLRAYKNDDYTQKLIAIENLLVQAEGLYKDESAALSDISKEKEKIQQQIVEDTKKLIKLETNIPQLAVSQSSKTGLERKIVLLQQELDKDVISVASLAQQLIDVEKIIKEMENKNVVELNAKLQKLNTKKAELNGKFDKLKTLVTHELEIIQKAKAYEYDSNCKFCMSNSSKVVQEAEEAKTRLEKYKTNGLALKTELDSVKQEIDSYDWLPEAVEIYATSVSKRSNIQSLQLRTTSHLTVAQNTLTTYHETIKTIDKDIELYNKNADAIDINGKVELQIEVYKQSLAGVEYSYKTKNKILLDLNGKISVCKSQMEEINDKIKQIKVVEHDYKLYEAYTQAVSRDGIPFDVITATVPEIETEVNNILGQIGDFTAAFETDGKNIIPYIVYGPYKWHMSLTSGFEKFALSLAIRVALINISNLPKPNFLIVDEGFGVLDAEHLTQVSTLFAYLKTSFDFIIIVSHLEALRDIVDKHIEITKDNGFSKVNFS